MINHMANGLMYKDLKMRSKAYMMTDDVAIIGSYD